MRVVRSLAAHGEEGHVPPPRYLAVFAVRRRPSGACSATPPLVYLMARDAPGNRMTDMSDGIDYGTLMHDAMRGLIAGVLKRVEREGLPGEHHFFISFDTNHPGVDIADWLHDRYPEDMTIVLQHWYDGLEVREDGFSVTLNFGDSQEPLVVPWGAMKTFVDPSVEFGLRFERREDENGPDGPDDDPEGAEEAPFAEVEATRGRPQGGRRRQPRPLPQVSRPGALRGAGPRDMPHRASERARPR